MVASSNPDASSAPGQVLAGMVELQRNILKGQLDCSSALNTIAERACAFTNASGAAIGILERGKLIYHAAVGDLSGGPASIDESRAIARQCLRTGRILHCNDLLRMESSVDLRRIQRLGVRSLLAVPVMHRRVAVGSLEVVAGTIHAFSQEQVRILQLMSRLVWLSMSRSREGELQARINDERAAIRNAMAALTSIYDRLSAKQARGDLLAESGRLPQAALNDLRQILDSLKMASPVAGRDALAGKLRSLNELVSQPIIQAGAELSPGPPDTGRETAEAATTSAAESVAAPPGLQGSEPVRTARNEEPLIKPALIDKPEPEFEAFLTDGKPEVFGQVSANDPEFVFSSDENSVEPIANLEAFLNESTVIPHSGSDTPDNARNQSGQANQHLGEPAPSNEAMESFLAQLGNFIESYESGETLPDLEPLSPSDKDDTSAEHNS